MELWRRRQANKAFRQPTPATLKDANSTTKWSNDSTMPTLATLLLAQKEVDQPNQIGIKSVASLVMLAYQDRFEVANLTAFNSQISKPHRETL